MVAVVAEQEGKVYEGPAKPKADVTISLSDEAFENVRPSFLVALPAHFADAVLPFSLSSWLRARRTLRSCSCRERSRYGDAFFDSSSPAQLLSRPSAFTGQGKQYGSLSPEEDRLLTIYSTVMLATKLDTVLKVCRDLARIPLDLNTELIPLSSTGCSSQALSTQVARWTPRLAL